MAISPLRADSAPPFSLPAQRYLASHAIDQNVAMACGVREDNGALLYPYRDVHGRVYVRSRQLGPGKNITKQPKGEALTVWWPLGQPRQPGELVLVCEGEPDALAALTALQNSDGPEIAVCAVPGASFPASRLLESLASISPSFCLLVPDGDEAGRRFAEQVLAAADASPLRLRMAAVQLAEDQDLADTLAQMDPAGQAPGYWLRSMVIDHDTAWEGKAADIEQQEPIALRITDTANADRFARAYTQMVRYVHDERVWRIWDGRHWNQDERGQIMTLAMDTAKGIYEEAMRAGGDDAKQLMRHATRSSNHNKLKAMLELAQSDARLAATVDEFDAEPLLLNCQNGIVDLRTGQLLDHRPELLCSQIVAADYDPEHLSGQFAEFVWECVGGDDAYYDWLQRAVGYSLTGDVSEETIYLLMGRGATGKSTLLSAVQRTLNSYSATAEIDAFVRQQAGRPRNDVARLRGKRFVAVTELEQRADLAAALLKSITGGDTMTARMLYQEAQEFHPRLKLWIASNHLPAIDSLDSGMFRRLRVLPFDHTPKVPRPQLKRDLTDPRLSGSHILAWAVQGAIKWANRPLTEGLPGIVEQACLELEARHNPCGVWMRRLVVDESGYIPSRELYQDFLSHSTPGARPVSEKEFSGTLKRAGFPFVRAKNTNGFRVQLAA